MPISVFMQRLTVEWLDQNQTNVTREQMCQIANACKGKNSKRVKYYLSSEYAIDSSHLVAVMHDRASVNDAAMMIVNHLMPILIIFTHVITKSHYSAFYLCLIPCVSYTKYTIQRQISPFYSAEKGLSLWSFLYQTLLCHGFVRVLSTSLLP